MSAETETFEVTSSPVAALLGAALLVGVERDDAGDLKVYLGARYRGIYMVVPAGDNADGVEGAWNGSRGHMFVRPVPSSDCLFCDREEAVG
jgi:hypothetical protein